MKITSALVASLLNLGYGASLAAAQSSYSKVCGGYHTGGRQATIDDNYPVTYHCDSQLSLPDTFHLASTGVTSAEGCARLCRDDPSGCRGAVWGHQQEECWISNSNEGGKIIRASSMLYIEPSDDITDLQRCKSERAHLRSELEKCRANNDGNGRTDDNDGNEGSGEKCPYNDLSKVTASGKTYKVYCKRLDDDGGANLHFFTAANAQACIQACSARDDCKRAVWQTKATLKEATGCWLRDYSAVAKVPTIASGYSSAHLQ